MEGLVVGADGEGTSGRVPSVNDFRGVRAFNLSRLPVPFVKSANHRAETVSLCDYLRAAEDLNGSAEPVLMGCVHVGNLVDFADISDLDAEADISVDNWAIDRVNGAVGHSDFKDDVVDNLIGVDTSTIWVERIGICRALLDGEVVLSNAVNHARLEFE